MKIDVATLFPGMFDEVLGSSILGRARGKGILDAGLYDIRDFSSDRHRTVDDRPYGGGPGMLLRPEPVVACVETILAERGPGHVVLLTPGGRTFTQAVAREFAQMDHLVLVCGRYEGFDARIRQVLRPDELSIGPYVLSGGEIAAMSVIDAVVRLLPGALGDAESAALESYTDGDDLEAPQWTRPPVWRGLAVPEALTSGDHARIARWRSEEARKRTESRRRADADQGDA
ncbi:MAG: tRNA (guanosine(37)-N1)-methyltransferase TrmD [Planctomycetes bacterium]|nr:tRNA (guanosine(37)-N1)-methyltransferase TrmD [Planctomycetota bacterium]